MTMKLGVVMDPIARINIKKDTTFAMLLEAQARKFPLYYMEQKHLYVRDGVPRANAAKLTVKDDAKTWFSLAEKEDIALSDLDIILMRVDPPFNMEYIYTTYLLELAENAGARIVNKPQSLRDANEKFYTSWFPDCCPPTLITRSHAQIKSFLQEHRDIIVKPLEGMGGASVFRLTPTDPNSSVIMENLTHHGTHYIMAQLYIPEITKGDKRIIMINGEAIPYALARIPAEGETRGNLAAGAKGVGVELTENDKRICARVGPVLRDKGLLFVGLDVIGDYLTEINVTSPTCVREIEAAFDINISAKLLDCLQQ